MRTILDYMGTGYAGLLVKGATNSEDAIKRLGENPKAFNPPVVSVPLPKNVERHVD